MEGAQTVPAQLPYSPRWLLDLGFYCYFIVWPLGLGKSHLVGNLVPSRPLEGRLSMGVLQPQPASLRPGGHTGTLGLQRPRPVGLSPGEALGASDSTCGSEPIPQVLSPRPRGLASTPVLGQGHRGPPGDHAGDQGTVSPDAVRIHIREPGQARPETLSPCSDEDVAGWLKGVTNCEHCSPFPASLLQGRQSAPRRLAHQHPEYPSPLCQHGTQRFRSPACCTISLLEALSCSLAPVAATAGTTAKRLPAWLPRGQRRPAVIASAAHTVKIVSSTFPCSHQRESLQRTLLILRWGKRHARWMESAPFPSHHDCWMDPWTKWPSDRNETQEAQHPARALTRVTRPTPLPSAPSAERLGVDHCFPGGLVGHLWAGCPHCGEG